jgi:NTP pyrophosphatase (non-canonical NTP hydrolase)
MDIAAYQRWFAEYDRLRSLDLVEPSQVTVHLMEEVGEIAREVLYLEGYRNPHERDDAVALLSGEIGDALVFLTKIAIHYGIDLDTVAANVMHKAEGRWPPDEAHREMERYIQHQQAANAERTADWRTRNPQLTRPQTPEVSETSGVSGKP